MTLQAQVLFPLCYASVTSQWVAFCLVLHGCLVCFCLIALSCHILYFHHLRCNFLPFIFQFSTFIDRIISIFPWLMLVCRLFWGFTSFSSLEKRARQYRWPECVSTSRRRVLSFHLFCVVWCNKQDIQELWKEPNLWVWCKPSQFLHLGGQWMSSFYLGAQRKIEKVVPNGSSFNIAAAGFMHSSNIWRTQNELERPTGFSWNFYRKRFHQTACFWHWNFGPCANTYCPRPSWGICWMFLS